MMYKHDDVVRDFVKRTRQNLRAIERLRDNGDDVYEVTQLVNSMLGLLVFPREEYVQHIPQIPMAELAARGWPIPRVVGGFLQAADLRELIRYLRNAIAHFNVEFIGDGTDQIRTLRLWNKRTGTKTWEAEVGVEELRGIADRFGALILSESN